MARHSTKDPHIKRVPSSAVPLTICLICMALMWLEAVLGLCLGCEIHGALVRRGWLAKGGLGVVELGAKEPLATPAGFTQLDVRVWGAARVEFLMADG